MSMRSSIRVPQRLTGSQVPRTTTKDQNPLIYSDTQDRRFITEFFRPTIEGAWFSTQTYPGKLPGKEEVTSYWYPPPHYHFLQDEYFKVVSGEGIWSLYGGKKVHLKNGDEITIPARRWHTFQKIENESEEPLVILYKYDREYADMEERFFRNTFGYFNDCRKAGIEPSMFQVSVFLMHCWMPIGLPEFGPEWLNMVLSTMLTVLLGCIGQFVMGFKASYPEYYEKDNKKAR